MTVMEVPVSARVARPALGTLGASVAADATSAEPVAGVVVEVPRVEPDTARLRIYPLWKIAVAEAVRQFDIEQRAASAGVSLDGVALVLPNISLEYEDLCVLGRGGLAVIELPDDVAFEGEEGIRRRLAAMFRAAGALSDYRASAQYADGGDDWLSRGPLLSDALSRTLLEGFDELGDSGDASR